MRINRDKAGVTILDCEDFDPQRIFESGQCFRWDEAGVGIAGGHCAKVFRKGDTVRILCEPRVFDAFWYDYFDLGRDYCAVRRRLHTDQRLHAALDFGKGVRILHQEPWEALISFLISQCNHISRIKAIIETLCQRLGEAKTCYGATRYTFPSAERLAACTPEDLALLRAGYRAPYLLEAAKRVARGACDLNAIQKKPTAEARTALMELPGVGRKVADCVLLFGMRKEDAFPVDVWMKRALDEFFDGCIPDFGDAAGIAQQYLFTYMRNGK